MLWFYVFIFVGIVLFNAVTLIVLSVCISCAQSAARVFVRAAAAIFGGGARYVLWGAVLLCCSIFSAFWCLLT